MRIPLLHADFEHGSFTKVAKALRKSWPLGDLSLMQSQDVLAVLLGYNGQHDARREAAHSFPSRSLAPDKLAEDLPLGLSMQKVTKAVAWRMFVRFGVDLLAARALASTIHLSELAVADITLEAMQAREYARNAARGVFVDEYWDYVNYKEPWPEQTPRLLARGIPSFRWAIFADRTVFEWSRMVSQIEMLPANFLVDLREAGKLEGAAVDDVSFMMRSLLPAACRPLSHALASGLEPSVGDVQSWKVKWIVDAQAEVLGRCIVAEQLAGVIPRVFSVNGSDVYEAMAALLCGDSVELPPSAPIYAWPLVDEPLWLVDRSRMLWLREGTRKDVATDHLWNEDRASSTVRFHRGPDGALHLAAQKAFEERGQVYTATRLLNTEKHRRMAAEEIIFETLLTSVQRSSVGEALKSAALAELRIPARGSQWHSLVDGLFSKRKADVEAVARTLEGVAKLQGDVSRCVLPQELDAFVAREIEEALPLRYGPDGEDSPELARERNGAIALAEGLGARVQDVLPRLKNHSLLSLGYMVLVMNGEYPGSRHQYLVDPPAAGAFVDQARLLAAMLVYDGLTSVNIDWTALYCAIAPVVGIWTAEPRTGTLDRPSIVGWYTSAHAVRQELKVVETQLDGVEKWRNVELGAEGFRRSSGGQYLRSGDAIPTERPRSPAEAFSAISALARSRPIQIQWVSEADAVDGEDCETLRPGMDG